jgi:hypothetical protein
LAIQSLGGLVGEENIWTGDQCPGNRQSTSLSAREASAPRPDALGQNICPEHMSEPDELQNLKQPLVISVWIAYPQIVGD